MYAIYRVCFFGSCICLSWLVSFDVCVCIDLYILFFRYFYSTLAFFVVVVNIVKFFFLSFHSVLVPGISVSLRIEQTAHNERKTAFEELFSLEKSISKWKGMKQTWTYHHFTINTYILIWVCFFLLKFKKKVKNRLITVYYLYSTFFLLAIHCWFFFSCYF